MAREIIGDITDIKKGAIMHQVNCQAVMGAGVAKALYTKYPQIKRSYLDYCQGKTDVQLLGSLQAIHISNELIVLNSYSQRYYGNSAKTNRVYTDSDALKRNLRLLDMASQKKSIPAYVPDRIGCGLAGGDWNEIKNFILNETNIIIVKLP